jgi:hypothetical protein
MKLPTSSEDSVDTSGQVLFSDVPLLTLIISKPLVDAMYFVPPMKYLYMLMLLLAALLAFAGNRIGARNSPVTSFSLNLAFGILPVLVAYAGFLLAVASLGGGGLQEVFKILSPFVLYLIVRANITPALRHAIFGMAVLVVLGNALLLPFDFGWTYWGAVHTFKGFYYFKTDLAFALVTSLVLIGLYFGYRMRPMFVFSLAVAGAQVVLSNSRLNYLAFGLLLLFVIWMNGARLSRLVGAVFIIGSIAAMGALLYDPVNFLSPFDTADLNRFTQGRESIWRILYERGWQTASIADAIFGRGLGFDSELIGEHGFGFAETHNAHNEFIHLLLTQGLLGLFSYGALWWVMTRDAVTRGGRDQLATVVFAISVLGLQSLTTVVSSFASKTWPIVFVFLMVQAANARKADRDRGGLDERIAWAPIPRSA